MTTSLPDEDAGEILDSHCHAWRRWPYPPLVPDEQTRGSIAQLLFEMDTNQVKEALVVCAAISGNPDNIEYVAFARDLYPGVIRVAADLDCTWSSTYHTPGSAERLRSLDDSYRLAAFTHYVSDRNDGWLLSDEADRVFSLAAERKLIVSLAASPAWQGDLRTIARRFPSVPILCHHLGAVRAAEGGSPPGLADVLASAEVPNIFVKVSGFHYCSSSDWDHPWQDALLVFEQIFDAYGPSRLCWGSDFPASKRYCTFKQSLEVVRRHAWFLTESDRNQILGGTLRRLFETGQAVS